MDGEIGSSSRFSREEVLRIIHQSLVDLGLPNTSKLLEEESKITFESAHVQELRASIFASQWPEALQLAQKLSYKSESMKSRALFLIYRQQYLELLFNKQEEEALYVLQSYISPIALTPDLCSLTSLILCTETQDLEIEAQWSYQGSKQKLFDEISVLVVPSQILPAKRLESLLSHAVNHQLSQCIYHNSQLTNISLLEDHTCSKDGLPLTTDCILEGHQDEVWFIQFSHNGRFLASASKDETVVIWSIHVSEDPDHPTLTVNKVQTLRGHGAPLSYLAWSPDDRHLLTCGTNSQVKLWDIERGICENTYFSKLKEIPAVCWLPDGSGFILPAEEQQIYLYNTRGVVLKKWTSSRANDFVISSDGKKLIVACQEKKIVIHCLDGHQPSQTIQEIENITSIALSSDNRYVAVNLTSQEIHVWDLETLRIVDKFSRSLEMGRYVIRICFGGHKNAFLVSGSEESKIFIWHRETGKLLQVLDGHFSSVNAVAWNPQHTNLFASAGDDRTIRIWFPTNRKYATVVRS